MGRGAGMGWGRAWLSGGWGAEEARSGGAAAAWAGREGDVGEGQGVVVAARWREA